MKMPPLKSARMLKYAMIILIVITLVGIGYIFLLAKDVLTAKSVETDHARIDARLAEEEISRLKQLETQLKGDEATIEKTAKIVAESQSYTFQDQVIRDLTSYAEKSGVGIIMFDFGQKPGEKPASVPGSTANSLNRTIVSIQLENNIPYRNLLTFVKSIEQNVTKMQLSGINFQPKKDDPTQIIGSTIKIEVYLR